MGLDMYLTGEKRLWADRGPGKDLTQDGYKVESVHLELGYWRKHPNLHGYIVTNFAGGVDECQDIDLGEGNLEELIAAVADGELPRTSGFFFGESDGSEKDGDLRILRAALAWLRTEEDGVARSVTYRASW